ncbi:MAG: DNA methyltransferase [Brevinema sp.]
MKFHEKIIELLKRNSNYCDQEGELIKAKIADEAHKNSIDLLKILLSDDVIKAEYFQEVESVKIFLKDKFLMMLQDKNFLLDSYTSFKNKIGLADDQGLIKENGNVVLNFPFKDCTLEGGQSKDDDKRRELFFNEVLAKDELDRLLDPKGFVNVKRISQKVGKPVSHKNETPLENFRLDELENIKDNLLIKGNNLLALHSLKKRFAGKVKLIYIDPPYNTGNDSFNYNDSFNHSTWLVFMKNRLEIARELLAQNGVIFVQCDDNEQAYLKVLMDEIFGRENFTNNIIWQKKFSPQNDARWFSDNHDFIIAHAKSKDNWKINLLPRTEEANARYSNPDNDPRGDWTSGAMQAKTYSKIYDYPVKTPSGRIVNPPKGTCWRFNRLKLQEMISDNRIWFGENGDNTPRIKRFLSEVKDGITPLTIWLRSEVADTQEARKEIVALTENEAVPFKTPKGEKLIERIISLATQEGDIVLDFFAGTGTTASVAHKMKRQWITIEQMDYIEDITKARLKKVLDGEQGGISKSVNWAGGGDFVYMELAPFNQKYKQAILACKTADELITIYKEMREKAFLDYRYDLQKELQGDKDFIDLSFEEQQKILIDLLDKNQMYVPYTEIEDTSYGISKDDITASHKFYGGK